MLSGTGPPGLCVSLFSHNPDRNINSPGRWYEDSWDRHVSIQERMLAVILPSPSTSGDDHHD